MPPPPSATTSLPDLLEHPTFEPPPPPPPPPAPSTILSAWSRLRSPTTTVSALEELYLHRRSLRLTSHHLDLLLPLLPLHPYLVSPLLSSSPHLLTAFLPPSLPLSPRLLLLGSLASAKNSKNNLGNADRDRPKSKNIGNGESGDTHCDDPVAAVSFFLESIELGSKTLDDFDHFALAGVGYTLSCSSELLFRRIIRSLLRICGRIGSLSVGVRLLKLMEWLVLGFVESRKMRKVQVLFEMVSPEKCESEGYVLFPVVMAACGALRAMRVASVRYRLDFDPRLKEAPEQTIRYVADKAVLEERQVNDRHVLVQCVALGLTRCGQVAFHVSVFHCVCRALLEEVLPLPDFLRMSVQSPDGNSADVVKNRVKQHKDSVLFNEAGPVTGVLCNQYTYADEKAKDFVENCVWAYAQELYCHLRAAVLLHHEKRDDLLSEMEKVAEAAFLMVVVFTAEITKHRLNTKSSGGFQPEVAVRVLVAFSCVEHLRRVRLPEYTDAVRRAVLVNQENAAASALFIESMPSYAELTSKPDLVALDGTRYLWYKDEVQTSRILFYLRVIPTCVSLVPAGVVREQLASTMFLYMQHPNEKVTRASHSVMVSFLSSGNDTDEDERTDLKEQLVFYYLKRSLEAYPGVTPFEGLASGVAALVRHLPAGSPAILFCIHGLVVKSRDLCSSASNHNTSLWRSWEGSTAPCKKILDLLLRLIFLVDIQSFPYLLRELAEFVSALPKEGQDVLLDDMHAHVAQSDDVTRKPVLVTWLQSLAYISSQAAHQESSNKGDELELNRTRARL